MKIEPKKKPASVDVNIDFNHLIEKSVDDTVEIEPSFYHKEEISEDVKSVIRHLDNVLN